MRTHEDSKRRRAADPLPLELHIVSEGPPGVAWDDDAFWESFFNPLLPPQPFPEQVLARALSNADPQTFSTRKRPQETSASLSPGNPAPIWLSRDFLELEPSTALLPARTWPSEILNPFIVDGFMQHPRLRQPIASAQIPEDGCINGLMKVRLSFKKPDNQPIGRL